MKTGVKRLALLVSLGCALAACGGEKEDDSPGGLELFVAEGPVRLGAGGTRTLAVSVARFEAAGTGDVALTVSGLPAGVQASFNRETLPDQQTEAVLTLSATEDAPRGDATLVVTATKGTLSARRSVPVTVVGPMITGQVLTQRGEASQGFIVLVEGLEPQVTDAEGRFEFEDVTRPYTLTVVRPADGYAHRYEGLSTLTPELRAFPHRFIGSDDARLIRYSGAVTWPAWTAGDRMEVWFESLESPMENVGRSYSSVAWTFHGGLLFPPDDAEHPVRMRLFMSHWDAVAAKLTILGASQRELSVKHGDDVALGTFEPAGVVTEDVTTTVTMQASATVNQLCAYQVLAYGVSRLYCQPGLSANATIPVVRPASGKIATMLRAVTPEGDTLYSWLTEQAPPESIAAHQLEAPIHRVSPTDGTVGAEPTPTFTVENPTGRPLTFEIEETTYPYRKLFVTTTKERTGYPDLSALGVPVPQEVGLRWRVMHSSTVQTMDDAATAAGILPALEGRSLSDTYGLPLSAPNASASQTTYWTFTLGNP